MFIRTLILFPLLWLRLLFETAPPAGDAGGAGAAGSGGEAGGDKSKAGGDKTPTPANGDAASATGAAAAGTDGQPVAGVDPRIKQANDQAANERVKRREAEDQSKAIRDAFAPVLKAMGIEVPGAQVDPVKLAQDVEGWKAKYREERVGNVIQKLATAEGAKPELMLRYLKGGSELAELDPDHKDFEATAKAVVQAAIAAEPTLKAAGAAPRQSGGDFSAGANGNAQSIEQKLSDAAEKGDWKLYNRLMEEFAAAKSGAASASTT
jgi:hypothetical protein